MEFRGGSALRKLMKDWPSFALTLQSFFTVNRLHPEILIKSKKRQSHQSNPTLRAQLLFCPENSHPYNVWCSCSPGSSSHLLTLCPAPAPPTHAFQAPALFLHHFLERKSFRQGQEPILDLTGV